MISCEDFERQFPRDDSPELLEHREKCPFCRSFTVEIAVFRAALAAFPPRSAPLGFENRLYQRLDEILLNPEKSLRVVPNALAFASGLAVAVTAGLIYTSSFDQQNPPAVFSPENGIAGVTEIAPDSIKQDSTRHLQEPWSVYWNYESVSAQP